MVLCLDRVLFPPLPIPPKEEVKEIILKIARHDNEEDFVFFMRVLLKHHREEGNVYTKEFSEELLKNICLHRAVRCATVFLEGDCRFTVDDLNVVLEVEQGLALTPLHLAARSLCYDLTKLFLLYGANPNLSFDSGSSDIDTDSGMLPLSAALEALSNHQLVTKNWSLDCLPYTLIYIFFLKEMVEPFDTISLLSTRTAREHLLKISLGYAEQGEVVKLAALLLVAWDKLMTPYAKQGVKSCPIGQCVRKQIESLPDEQVSSNLEMLDDRKAKLEAAWKMLKVLWNRYDTLNEYRYGFLGPCFKKTPEDTYNHQVPMTLARRMGVLPHRSMLMLKDVFDDTECFKPGLSPKEKGFLDEALENQKRSGSTILHVPKLVHKNNGIVTSFCSARQFHSSSKFSLRKELKGQLAKVEKLSVQMCTLLFSIAKRGFK